MPLLSYSSSNFPFTPFTKIYSADVNSCYNDIKTLLNTTKLDYLNAQTHGFTRNGSSSNLTTGTANALLINDSNGDMSELVLGTALQVAQVNSGATAIVFGGVPTPPALNVFNFYQYS